MTWYKTAQSEIAFQSWLGKVLKEQTKDYTQPVYGLAVKVPMIKRWYLATNADLNKYNFDMALTKTYEWFEENDFDEMIPNLKPEDLNKEVMANVIESYMILEFEGKKLNPDTIQVKRMEVIGPENRKYYRVTLDYEHPSPSRISKEKVKEAQLSTVDGQMFYAIHI